MGGAGGDFWTFGSIPPGMTTNSGGSLGGTPTQAGTFQIPVGVFDSLQAEATATVTITVTDPPIQTLLDISPSASPAVGVYFNTSWVASGGDGHYKFSVTGTLPPGLSTNAQATDLILAGTPTTAGTYNFSFKVSDGSGQSASLPVAFTVTGGKKTQTITFTLAPSLVPVGQSVPLNGSTDSNQTVSYTSTNTAVCSISGQNVTMNAPGACTVTASQDGNATYAPAISVSRSVTAFTVKFSPAAVTLSSPGVLTATVTVSSNPPGVPIGVTGGVSFFAASVGAPSTPSLVTIYTNSDTPPGTYMGAATTTLGNIPVTLVVTPTLKPQSIAFKPHQVFAQTGTSATLTATASSTLPVTYSSANSAVCTVDGATGATTFVSSGSCTISAAQPGDQNTWAAATPASATVVVFAPLGNPTGTLPQGTVGISYEATLTVTNGYPPYQWSISGALPAGLSFNSGAIAGTPTGRGTFPINVKVSDTAGGMSQASLSLVVNAAGSATIGASPSGVNLSAQYGGAVASGNFTLTFTTPTPGANPPAWSATSSAAWIGVPASGALGAGTTSGGLTAYSTNIGINANPAGQLLGSTSGSVTFTVNGISVAVPVTLTLTPVALTLAPASLSFTYTQGGPAPAAQNVVVDSPAAEGIALNAFPTTASGGNWLSVSSGATAPATLSVSLSGAALGALSPATYMGFVNVVSPASNPVVRP